MRVLCSHLLTLENESPTQNIYWLRASSKSKAAHWILMNIKYNFALLRKMIQQFERRRKMVAYIFYTVSMRTMLDLRFSWTIIWELGWIGGNCIKRVWWNARTWESMNVWLLIQVLNLHLCFYAMAMFFCGNNISTVETISPQKQKIF